MKVSFPPPPYLLARLRPHPDSPVAVVRAFYVAAAWSQSWWGRLQLLAGLAIWPVATALLIARHLRRNGATISIRSGRSRGRQALDQFLLAARYGLSPREYYAFELYEDGPRRQADHYFNRHETSGVLMRELERRSGRGVLAPMTDKEAFTAKCRAANLAVIPILCIATRDGLRSPAGADTAQADALPACDLFFKPMSASIKSVESTRALSASRWDYAGDERYRSTSGEVLSREALVARARDQSAGTAYLIQPRLENHPAIADLSNGALLSVTIQTFLDEHDRPEVVAVVFHIAAGTNTLADNASLGGLIAAVDIERGIVGPATDGGKRVRLGWCDVHPDSGVPIKGRQLPIWSEALDLARRAHATFPERFVVGWDMALTPSGPVLIEGDPRGFVTLKQRAYGKPFGPMRYGQLFAHHIRRLDRRA